MSEITNFFYPRLIVVDGLVLPVSTSPHFPSSGNRLWIPSTIAIIPSKCVPEQTHIKSIMFEIGSKLRSIQTETFSGTFLEFIIFPNSVEVLGSKCFSEC
jgi:hypothetical protein